jgi:hypothetical protein
MKTLKIQPPKFGGTRCQSRAWPLAIYFSLAFCGLAQPTITRQPTNISVSLGATAQFRVYASGTAPLTFQWQHEDAEMAGATSATLSITNVQVLHAGRYTVVVSDATGSVTSAPAFLDADPTFTKITSGDIVTDKRHWHGQTWGDYDNDGYPDLFIHDVNASKDWIYHNNGDGTFTRLSAPIPQGLTAADGAWANAGGDYDNDSHLDLFLANPPGKNLLLHNRGDGTFEQVRTSPSGESTRASSASWADYDRDGYLDLFVVNSYEQDQPGLNTLYHNQGDGTFAKMTASQVGPIVSGSAIWIADSWVDFNDDGWPDLLATKANSKPCLYHNLANGQFGLVTNSALVASDMTITVGAWADYDNDGRLDVCFAGRNTLTLLFHQEPDGTFTQISGAQVGIPVSDRSEGGGVAWGDYDNDGYVDLFMAGGWWTTGPVYTKSLLYHNNGDGTFTPVRTGSPVNDVTDSNGAYWIDYNRDGSLDLFVWAHGHEPVSAPNLLYRNNGNSNNWLVVSCVGTSSPRFGTGAKVRAKATIRGEEMWQLRLIDSGGTCGGGQSFEAHFGLGDATVVDTLRIEWPSGLVRELHSVAAKQILTVTEPTKLEVTGRGQFRIRSWRGMAYEVQSSSDLRTWQPVATVTDLNGTLEFTDTAADQQAARFYRARSP